MTPKHLKLIRELNLKKKSDSQIALKLGVSRSLITYHRKRMKIQAIPCRKIDLAQLKELTLTGLSDAEISRQLGISQGAVTLARNSLNLPAHKQYNFRHNDDPDFPFDVYDPIELMKTDFGQVLIGTMLGDGFIPAKNHNYFRFDHQFDDGGYQKWKIKKLYPFSFKIKKNISKTGYGFSTQNTARTPVYPFTKHLRKIFYPIEIKIIPIDYLRLMDIRGLLVWVFDDGCIKRTKSNYDCLNMSIATCGFQLEEIQQAMKILQDKFGFEKLSITQKKEIYFSKKDTIRFCKLTINNLLVGLEHKIKKIKEISCL